MKSVGHARSFEIKSAKSRKEKSIYIYMEEKSTYMLKYTWVVDKVENVGRKSGKSQNNAPYCISRAHTHTHTAQLHCVRSLSGITIRSSRRCDLPRCNNITRSLVYFLADTKLLPRNYLNRRNEISRPPRKLYPQLYPRFLRLISVPLTNRREQFVIFFLHVDLYRSIRSREC